MDNRKKLRIVFIFTIIIVIVAPIGIGIGVSLPILPSIVNRNDWIGFWGGYLGAIIGGIITLYVLWSTVSNNEKARRRDEKIHFFEKIVELFSKFTASCGNMCALAMRLMVVPNNDLYRKYLFQVNDTSGISTEIDILLKSRKEIYDCEEFISKLSDVAKQINDFNDKFEKAINSASDSVITNDELEKDMDQILNKVSGLDEVLIMCLKNNLEVDI